MEPLKLSADMLKGAKKIADYTGFNEREVYEYFRNKTLPLFKIGKHVCGRKSQLNDRLSAADADR